MQRTPSEPPVWKDPVVWGALGLALVLRALPMLLWGWSTDDCTRDECIYKIAARPILAGDGLGLAPKGWLPAPGYPYLLAACHSVFGSFESVKWVQWTLTVPTMACFAAIADRVAGRPTARLSAWLFAVHPTFVFFVGTLWTESVYTLLLLAATLALLRAREGGWSRGALTGVLLGLCVLNRGIATYIAPIFLLALAVPETGPWSLRLLVDGLRARREAAMGFLLALVLTVAPYSVQASSRWGGFVVSDATVGHVIALGNDDYAPVTFDYMIGQLTGPLYAKTLGTGRRDCPRSQSPVAHDRCETERAVEWITSHPATFVQRIPTRLAQLFNPHSFLTRHLRWGFWPGLPWAAKEALVTWQVLFSGLVWGLGTWSAAQRARGPFGVVAVGIVTYTTAVIALMYGLTRFRLPLEPFWLIFAAWFLAEGAPAALSRWRRGTAIVTTLGMLLLMRHYLWTGYPGF